jgi:hypothetical protein
MFHTLKNTGRTATDCPAVIVTLLCVLFQVSEPPPHCFGTHERSFRGHVSIEYKDLAFLERQNITTFPVVSFT